MDDPLQLDEDPRQPEEAAADEGAYTFLRWLIELVLLVAIAFGVAYVLKVFVVQPFYIPSGSMEPTLMPGDRILVNKFVYRFHEPDVGDIVVFVAPRDTAKRDFIKRVVAVGGSEVAVRDGRLVVDGEPREEGYVIAQGDHSDYGPLKVPSDSVFVMGDNRANSSDSRVFGPLPKKSILGKAFIIYWPLRLQNGQDRLL